MEAERVRELEREYWKCPRGRLNMEPAEFLTWIQAQTPDTWHVVVCSFGDWDDEELFPVLDWIIDQPRCDVATAVRCFYASAVGMGDNEPEGPMGYSSKWHWAAMKRVAERWSAGFYADSGLSLSVEPNTFKWFDLKVAERALMGRPLPFSIPGPETRKFGLREARSAFAYQGFGGLIAMSFEEWLKTRETSPNCGRDFPTCCGG